MQLPRSGLAAVFVPPDHVPLAAVVPPRENRQRAHFGQLILEPLGGKRMSFDPELFVFIKIPGDIGPAARGDTFEDPIANALASSNLGEVSGGGSQLGDDRPDGTPSVEFCGIDVDVVDTARALAVLRAELDRLSATIGTELHYTREGRRFRDVRHDNGWVLGLERTFLHPAFEC